MQIDQELPHANPAEVHAADAYASVPVQQTVRVHEPRPYAFELALALLDQLAQPIVVRHDIGDPSR